MGQKVHPVGLRLGINRTWESKWYSRKQYREFLLEDLRIRKLIAQYFKEQNPPKDAAISRIEIERAVTKVNVVIHTAKPGVIIGRGGRDVDRLREYVQKTIGRYVHISVLEVKDPETDAQLVAESVASQIERRVAFRRAMRQAITRTMQKHPEKDFGIKIRCSGRLGGSEMARVEEAKDGKIPLHTLRANVDYGFAEAATTYGNIGVKTWVYKGDILSPKSLRALEQARARAEMEKLAAATETGTEGTTAAGTGSDNEIVEASGPETVTVEAGLEVPEEVTADVDAEQG